MLTSLMTQGDRYLFGPVEAVASLLRSVCREKAAIPAGANPTRQLVAPAGSNRSGRGGNESAEASDGKGSLGRLGEHAGRNVSER